MTGYDDYKTGASSKDSDGECEECHGNGEAKIVSMDIFGKEEQVYLCRECRITLGYEKEIEEEDDEDDLP